MFGLKVPHDAKISKKPSKKRRFSIKVLGFSENPNTILERVVPRPCAFAGREYA